MSSLVHGPVFSAEDVEDGVPGAVLNVPPRGEPRRHDPRQPCPPDPTLTAREWDESLDSPPKPIKVMIPGITPPVRGTDFWEAVEVADHPGYYRIVGDPNALAVGRFKASLRKFLGI